MSVPQSPAKPKVQTPLPSSPLLDLDQEDDVELMDTFFTTAPEQDFGLNRNQTKRHIQEASGGNNSPRGTPPSNSSSSHKVKHSSPRTDQVLSTVLLSRMFLKFFADR